MSKTKQTFDVAQKVILFRQKCVDVARKSISCQQKKLGVAQKSISWRQKQDGGASKKCFGCKIVNIFFQNGVPYKKVPLKTNSLKMYRVY